MKKVMSIVALVPFMFAEAALSANDEYVQVAFKKNSNFDGDPRYLPIALTINENPSDHAWLDITKNFRIIFNKETRTITDLSAALQSLRPARNLRYSCETSPLPLCERYRFFNFSYDYDSGRFQLVYELANKHFAELESEPAVVARQSLIYSENRGDRGTYRHGNWNADANVGLTDRSSLYSNFYYDLAVGKLSTQAFSYTYDLSQLFQLTGYVQKGPLADLSRLGVNKTKGISVQRTDDQNREVASEAEPIIIDAKYDGLINIYDELGKLIRTTQVMQGINRLDIPLSATGNTVRIEEVVDGQVVESYDRAITRSGDSASMLRFDLGMANLSNHENSKSVKKDDAPYLRYWQTISGITVGASALPTVGWYTTNLRLPSIKGVSASIESAFKGKHTEHGVTAAYNASIDKYDFYTSLAKQFGARESTSYSVGTSRRVFDNSRIDLFYNQSHSVYDPKQQNDYYRDSRHSKPVVTAYKRLTSRLRTRHNTSVGIFDYSFYVSSELGDDKRIGASVTYTPASGSKWLRPTIGIQSDDGTTNTYVVNDMQVADRFDIRPEVRFSDGKLNQYGSGARYTNDHFNSDFGYFRTTPGNKSFYVNGDSHSFLSRHGVQAHSSPKNNALVFNNSAENKIDSVPATININGQPNEIKHNNLHYLHSSTESMLSIYAESDNVALDPHLASLVVKPYRVHKISYLHENDNIHASGRVMLKGQPEEGIEVVNHAGRTITDRNGYFSLIVSRSNPSIALFRNGRACPTAIDDISAHQDENSNEIYLGRLQCDS